MSWGGLGGGLDVGTRGNPDNVDPEQASQTINAPTYQPQQVNTRHSTVGYPTDIEVAFLLTLMIASAVIAALYGWTATHDLIATCIVATAGSLIGVVIALALVGIKRFMLRHK